jgi:hypothetical protein
MTKQNVSQITMSHLAIKTLTLPKPTFAYGAYRWLHCAKKSTVAVAVYKGVSVLAETLATRKTVFCVVFDGCSFPSFAISDHLAHSLFLHLYHHRTSRPDLGENTRRPYFLTVVSKSNLLPVTVNCKGELPAVWSTS